MKYIFLLVLSSCSMLGFDGSEEELETMANASKNRSEKYESEEAEIVKEADQQEKDQQHGSNEVQDKRLDSLEFSLADIKSTLEEMKSFLEENSEKIKVLEKAFSLGIIPDRTSGLELTDEHFETKPGKRDVKEKKPISDDKKSKKSGPYSLKLSEAQNNFNGGKYKAAIALYKEIGQTYSQKLTHNNQYYWIGLSYFYLKQYDDSLKYLNMYVEFNPKGNWVPYSKYYLAKCLKEQGLERKSAMMLHKLIEEKASNSELREMAQYELRQMEQSI